MQTEMGGEKEQTLSGSNILNTMKRNGASG